MRIRIRQRSTENKRLAFTKAIKDFTGLDLRDSKDIADTINGEFDRQERFRVSDIDVFKSINGSFSSASIIAFSKNLKDNCSGDYVIDGGVEWERESKLLSIGIGSDSDYILYIKKMAMFKSNDEIEEFISDLLSNMSRSELEIIYDKIKIK